MVDQPELHQQPGLISVDVLFPEPRRRLLIAYARFSTTGLLRRLAVERAERSFDQRLDLTDHQLH